MTTEFRHGLLKQWEMPLTGSWKEWFKKLLGGTNIGENIILIWKDRTVWIKVIDYRKGYWAETAIKPDDLLYIAGLFYAAWQVRRTRGDLEEKVK